MRLLLVEDNAGLRRAIARALADRFAVLDEASDADVALERLSDPGVQAYDMVVTDLRMPGAEGSGGMAVLRAARARDDHTAVLLMTAYGTVEDAVEAMRLGAHDFIQKPFELEELEARVERALGHARLTSELASLREDRDERLGPDRIIGTSAVLRDAVALAERVAATMATVLVTGETGTGKELIAGLVHSASERSNGPFIKVNCAALPETLLESELFGHERGAFTSADRLRIGRFEQADGGTLFLDEIGDLSLVTQAKLLRVLQDQEFQRLGGSQILRTDVRIVAATNHELPAAIEEGAFREDLFFRLNVIGIELPALRERPEDVEALAGHFLEELAAEVCKPLIGFAPDAMARLRTHPWPGNVRELRNVIERAVLMSDGPRVEASDIGLVQLARTPKGWRPGLPQAGLSLDEIEYAVVLEALERCGFVQKEAAGFLGISRRKLNYMIGRMGITHDSWRVHRGVD
ncbi:MAG: sigma-54-dependent Fis family transcriptional regulator [bacterium]|nr:sigma-54-dependent Fis family transcriptional regulator [bacterium]